MTNENKLKLKFVLNSLFFVFLIFIGLLVFLTYIDAMEMQRKISKGTIINIPEKEKNRLILGNGTNYSLGSNQAKIVIIEFADFACPYCKLSFPKIREISTLYPDDVKYIFRDLPIVANHSLDLALAARCAGEQGFFWQMHDKLFINQGITEKEAIFALAAQTGADMEKFNDCYTSKKHLLQIQKDFSDAQELGIDNIGTPIWFINGEMIQGAIPDEVFDKLINTLIKN